MKILLAILLFSNCNFFTKKEYPDHFVQKRKSLFNETYPTNLICENKRYIKKIKLEKPNIDIQLECIKSSIEKVGSNSLKAWVSYDFKDFKKKLKFAVQNNNLIAAVYQIDYDNERLAEFETTWWGEKHYEYGLNFTIHSLEATFKIHKVNCNKKGEGEFSHSPCYIKYYNKDGSIESVFDDDNSCCTKDCAEIIPFIHLGKYEVIFKSLIVYEEPSSKSNRLYKLDIEDKVEVLEDMQVFEKIDEDIAPFVRIKTKSFLGKEREGFIYSAGIAKIK